MRIDTNIVVALDSFAKANKLTKKGLADYFAVSGATVTKWHKVGSGITGYRWDNDLFPKLKPYLPQERIYIDDAGIERYSSTTEKQSKYFFEPKYIPIRVPLFTLETISGYDDTLDSITQYAQGITSEMVEYRPKSKQRASSVFAIRLSGSNVLVNFPATVTTAYVSAGDRPLDCGLVVCRPVNGTAFVAVYRRDGSNFTISEIGGTQKITGSVAQAKQLIGWIYPVLYTESVTF